jgi:hypothetical protein
MRACSFPLIRTLKLIEKCASTHDKPFKASVGTTTNAVNNGFPGKEFNDCAESRHPNKVSLCLLFHCILCQHVKTGRKICLNVKYYYL